MRFSEVVQLSPHCDPLVGHARKGVLIHHTVMSYDETIAHMLNPQSRVSYHAVIAKTGERCQLVPDEKIAWHAGVSTFQGQTHCNAFLLGLAFAGDTYRDALTGPQLASALEWLGARWSRYQLTPEWVVDHRQVAPGRKDDLNPTEWDRFYSRVLGWADGRTTKKSARL